MTEQAVHRCVCTQLHPRELIEVWQHRAAPVIRRMALHGHPVHLERLNMTLSLIERMSLLHDDCFALDRASHSHHAKECPAARRNWGKHLTAVSAPALVAAASVPVPAWRMR